MPTPTIWHIPYKRNPYFTGREDVLSQLHRALHAENTVALSHPQGISGLGGIGKTQTALEYAYRYRSYYNAIFWVRADSTTALTSGLVELAHILELPERHEEDQDLIVQAVLRWLRLHTNWLLIYDNMDDLSIAEPFLPKAGAGHLLFTTRAYALGGLASRLEIQKMVPEIGALLLLRRASLLAFQDTLSMANPDNRSIAQAISEELDGLPLALDQTGAYIKEAPCPLPDYLPRYQTRRSDILRERGQFDQDYPASVATTWSLSFEKVSEVNPASVELLHFCAFLAPEAIPETMITQGAMHLPSHLQDVVVHSIQFDRTTTALLAYSLLRRNTDETLSVHRLVQAVVRDNLASQERGLWMKRAVLAVNKSFPSVELAQWTNCESCLPHALVCATWIEQEQMTFGEAKHLLTQAATYLYEHARYVEAQPLCERVLAIEEQTLGPTHPDTATALNNLASLYNDQGKYGEALPLYERALAIREQTLEATHPGTALSLNNLALFYQNRGQYAKAEPLYTRALGIFEQALKVTHPKDTHANTARTLDNLAGLYQVQGKYGEAEPLYTRALAIKVQFEGAAHPSTAITLNNLACLCEAQGKYGEAELFYQRARAIFEQTLGASHPDAARNLNSLAHLYQTQGKYGEAEPLYAHALAINEQTLGATHPDVAQSLNSLAHLYQTQGKYGEAEPLFERALAIREKSLGPTHPDTALSLNNLGYVCHALGKYGEAELFYQRALAIDEQTLEANHPDTALVLNNLAELYRSQRKDVEAAPLHERALAIREKTLKADHPNLAQSLSNLGALYTSQGNYREARPLLERALAICEVTLGIIHPHTRTVRSNYDALLQALKRGGGSTK